MKKAALAFAIAVASADAMAPRQSGAVGLGGSLAFAPSILPLGRSQHTCVSAVSKKKAQAATGGGFGGATKKGSTQKPAGTTTVDAATLLRKSMDLYDTFKGFDEYDDESGFQEFKEYVVSVRAKGTPADQVSDWVPTAILGVVWKGGDLEDNALLQGIADHSLASKPALKSLRREVWECACQASPTLCKVARNAVEYAFEPLDGFHHILDEARGMGGSSASSLATLGLAAGASAADIKSAHRKLIRSLHPDTLGDLAGEERKAAEDRFKDVQRAYEVLGGGKGGEGSDSWYASLGGKSRHDTFSGPVTLDDSVAPLPSQYWACAVQSVDPDISREFFIRNTVRANLKD